MDKPFLTIIMAGGMGKRMKSDLPKVLHQLAGKPLIHYVIDVAKEVGSSRTIIIVGYKRELVREATLDSGVEWVVQEEQLGTGDAVRSCLPLIEDYSGDILVLSGDVPLLRTASIREALKIHRQTEAAVTVFTFIPKYPGGYGRIIRGDASEIIKIVEQKDATHEEEKVGEVNGGIYFYRAEALRRSLELVDNNNKAGEYYITDTISILKGWGERLSAYLVENPVELAGVNSREHLLELEKEIKKIDY